MDQTTCDTLFLPLENGAIPPECSGHRVLFVNACPGAWVERWAGRCAGLDSGYKRWDVCHAQYTLFHDMTRLSQVCTFPDIDQCDSDPYDLILILTPKDKIYTSHLMAQSLSRLKHGGYLCAAAPNRAGGGSLQKILSSMLDDCACTPVYSDVKNKCRVVWTQKINDNQGSIMKQALSFGELRKHEVTGFYTYPGIYGWDKIDAGSALLSRYIPHDLTGRGADFGCGYGYLSLQTLKKAKYIEGLDCFDNDYRAIQACEENCRDYTCAKMIWQDLIHDFKPPVLYDWIIMNPPFHDNHKTQVSLGCGFVESAARALKQKGRLYMVANQTLPYEKTIRSLFTETECMAQEKGFKVFCAVRP